MSDTGHGVKAVASRALKYALDEDPSMVACEVAWLDDGQLTRLASAARAVADVAEAERDGRQP